MIRPHRLALLVLTGGSAPGVAGRDGEAARAGLAEARPRDRRTAYAETLGAPRP